MATAEVKTEKITQGLKHPENERSEGECSNNNPIEINAVNQQGNEGSAINTSRFPNFTMGDVTVPVNTKVENLHIGPKAVLVGPVLIKGVTIDDISKVEKCICGEGKPNRHKGKKGTVNSRIKSIGKVIGKYWSVNRCAILATVIVLVECLVIFCYWVNAKNARTHVDQLCLREWKASDTFTNFSVIGNKSDESSFTGWHKGGKYFMPRNFKQFEHHCTVDCKIRRKSHVKFVMPGLFMCRDYISCRDFLIDEFNSYRSLWLDSFNNDLVFNDIYYNYFVTKKGIIYEGRPIYCRFDEPFLPKNYSSTIVIAVPFYFKNKQFFEDEAIKILWSFVLALLHNLKITGILIENPILELPIFCDNTYLSNNVLESFNLSFYEKDLYLKTHFNLQMIDTFLFLSDKPIANSAKFISIPEFNSFYDEHPFVNFSNSIKALPVVNVLTINFKFSKANFCTKNQHEFFKYPESVARVYKLQIDSCDNEVNYYMDLPSNLATEGVPLQCSVDLERNRTTVRIEVIGGFNFHYETDYNYLKVIKIYNRFISPIVKDMKEKIHYKGTHFELPCEYSEYNSYLRYALELLSNNISYVKEDGSRTTEYYKCH